LTDQYVDPRIAADRGWAGSVAPVPRTKPNGHYRALPLDDFRAYMPMHKYLYIPAQMLWPGASVNARIPPVKLTDENGDPVLDKEGRQVTMLATAWLDRHRPVEQMTWAPGLPSLILDKLILEGGWIERPGNTCFNLYQPPTIASGNAAEAGKWLDHVRYVYPDDAEHVLDFLSHRLQRPHEKINHALVLGGKQGIGKDSILEPVKYAVGTWNFREVSPQHIFGRFNEFLKAVILRINEAHDLGEFDRFNLYERLKSYTAAPPDVHRIDEKHVQEYAIPNCCGIVITTNHKIGGMFLPADDRRHYVAWSEREKEDSRFQDGYWADLWAYYENDGRQHVAAYLMQRDISKFDPKAPPPRTAAFWTIVDVGRASEEPEFADVLDALRTPDAVTLAELESGADGDFKDWLKDRKNRRVIPHRLEKCGYVPVRNPDAVDGLWKIGGKRKAVYANSTLTISGQIAGAQKLIASYRSNSPQSEASWSV
jgi:hypothetical protein